MNRTDYERVAKVIEFLDRNSTSQPSLSELAKVVGLSEFHFHRLFSKWAGTTPKNFLKYVTAQHAKKMLSESRDLLSVAIENGLSGPGRLHDLIIAVEGVSPGELKSRGRRLEIVFGVHETRFGRCLVALTDRGICHLDFFAGSEAKAIEELEECWAQARIISRPRETKVRLSEALENYLDGRSSKKTPLHLRGTSFQIKVWEALLRIPPGRLLAYSDIAKWIGAPKASRAVGSAIGKNPIAILIPCHRVIRETGAFGGYRWGLDRKRVILASEFSGNEITPDK